MRGGAGAAGRASAGGMPANVAVAQRWLRQAVAFMLPPADKPELVKAQFRAFTQQMPMMYAMLMTNTWAVAIIYLTQTQAPLWATLTFPLIMTVASGSRVAHWWSARDREPTPEIALNQARRTLVLAILMASGFVAWTVILFPYGDAYAQSLLAFFLASSIIGCIFCLMHNRAAAFSVAIIVNGGFVVFFTSTGQPALIASAIDIALVSIAMLIMMMINYRDFTRMVEAQVSTEALSNENFRLANLDSLTDLPNRRAFFTRLDEAVAHALQRRSRLALGIVDLDGFKPVNDLYGHPFGDRLLTEVGRRLAAICAPEGVYLARLGGDEFALILSDVESDEALLAFGQSLCEALRAPFALPEATVQIAGSAGFAVYPELSKSPEELFESADYALYAGKRSERRGNATLFSVEHAAEISRDARIEQALKMADLASELSVVFQPIVDVHGERTLGFEALARWNSPSLGRVPPDQFIPIAERAGIVSRLTWSLLEKALTTASRWPDDLYLSFNLSAQDLSSPESVLSIISIIEKSGFSARRLELEITETAVGRDFGQVLKAIDALKMMGCSISLDDFGTGYSSLSRLHALPLTKIKIDRSFIVDLHRNPASAKIVKSLLALSQDMGLGCVVEGVETKEEMAALRKLGTPVVQGYFYSPPIAETEIVPFLDNQALAAAAGKSRRAGAAH